LGERVQAPADALVFMYDVARRGTKRGCAGKKERRLRPAKILIVAKGIDFFLATTNVEGEHLSVLD
jgi:hypothetical protein